MWQCLCTSTAYTALFVHMSGKPELKINGKSDVSYILRPAPYLHSIAANLEQVASTHAA